MVCKVSPAKGLETISLTMTKLVFVFIIKLCMLLREAMLIVKMMVRLMLNSNATAFLIVTVFPYSSTTIRDVEECPRYRSKWSNCYV